MKHKLLPEIFTFTNSTSFNTSAPPSGGVVSGDPLEGVLGEKATLYVYAWETPNPPLNYLVFETLNADGTERGGLLTPNPLPQNQTFTYNLRENPILVVLIDNIGEATTASVKTKIVEEKVSMSDDNDGGDGTDNGVSADASEGSDSAGDGGRRLSMTDAEMDEMVEDMMD